jgi:ribosomal protein S27AE
MAHAPEMPERYVCGNCLVVSAGIVENVDGSHRYEEPTRCGACGEDAFIAEEQYPRHHAESGSTN